MSDKLKIKWCLWDYPKDDTPTDSLALAYLDGAILEPEPLFKFLSSSRDKNFFKFHFLKCYGLLEFCKNTFVVRAPIDITLNIDREKGYATTNACDQEFFDRCLKLRWEETSPNDRFTFTIFPSYLFYTTESTTIETLPLVLTHTKTSENTLFMPGRFNMYKWVRPVDFSCEVIDDTKPIVFKRGDPLFMIRFSPDSGKTVELERTTKTKELVELVTKCVGLKKVIPFTPLEKAYKIIEPVINLFRRSGKCPFHK